MTRSTHSTDAVSTELAGRRIAIPESRALTVLAALLERRGAAVWRCRLVAIHDNPDQAVIESWLSTAIETPFDRLIFLTGEGFLRLTAFAQRTGCETAWLAAVATTRTLVRGPKPGRAMKPFGVRPDTVAAVPTTAGIVQTLSNENLHGQRIGVQLYGEDTNRPLLDFLQRAGAEPFPVWPYRYADDVETTQVNDLIMALIAGEIDAIAFTSQPQIRRLLRVARADGCHDALLSALEMTVVAAIGPVVADELRTNGITPTVIPDSQYFMKPLVSALSRHLQASDSAVQ